MQDAPSPAKDAGLSPKLTAIRDEGGTQPNIEFGRNSAICGKITIKSKQTSIAKRNGVPELDALFVGPADLAAALGFGANQQHPDVRAKVIETIKRIKVAGKPAGLLTGDWVLQHQAIAAGIAVLALGVDVGILARGAEALRKSIEPG